MSFNRVTLVGNLGRDQELRYTSGGTAVGTLNLATTEKWTDKQGQKQERTEWSRIVVWGKQAETLDEFLKKGKQILVEGRLQTRQWDDNDGNKRYTTEIKADRIVLLGGGSRGGQHRSSRRDEHDQRRGGDDNGSQDAMGGDAYEMPGDEIVAPEINDSDIPF